MKVITINGDRITDIKSFHKEIDRVLTKNLDWKTGHNLDAFNDLLSGGFGVYDYQEKVKMIWKHFSKSKQVLGEDLTDTLLDIISDHKHITFSTED